MSVFLNSLNLHVQPALMLLLVLILVSHLKLVFSRVRYIEALRRSE